MLLAALVGLLLGPEVGLLRAIRLGAFDTYQRLAPRPRISAPAVIVAIDDASLARHGQWPWPRTTLARLLERIAAARPAAVGVDIVMPEADRLSPDRLPEMVPGLEPDLARRLARLPSNDAVLGAALGRMPAVLGVVPLDTSLATGAAPGRRTPVRVLGGEPQPFARRFAAVLRSVEAVDAAASGHGLVGADPDGAVVRRLSLVAAVDEALLPALGVEMLRVAAGEPAYTVRVGPRGIESVAVGGVVIPTAGDGTVWLHYAAPGPGRRLSAADVLSGRADPLQFERKLVLVGVTAIGLGDHHPTPVEPRAPGVEVQAQLLENIFDGDHLVRPRWARWAEAGALALLGVMLIAALPALPVRLSALIGIAVLLAVGAAGLLVYLRARVLLDAATPALGLAVTFAGVLGMTLAQAEAQRRALRRQLEAEREAAARIAGELEAARRIQMGILPDPVAALAGEDRVDVYAFLESARAVGGDLYDVFRLDRDRLFFLVGDVSGKGVPGSLFMAVSKALSKSAALRRAGDLAATMIEANAEIARDNAEDLFVTAWAGVLDAATGRLEYCNAGHEPALLVGGEAGPRRLGQGGGPPLCVIDDFPYETASEQLRPGDTLCLVTDGVTEAMNTGAELYGRTRLDAVLAGLAPRSAADVGAAVRADVSRFTAGAEASDDLTILVVRWNGSTASSGR